jgi:Ca2+-binding EF-hand superfamily protein
MTVFASTARILEILEDLGHNEVSAEFKDLSKNSSVSSTVPWFYSNSPSSLSSIINSWATERSAAALSEDYPNDEYIASLQRAFSQLTSNRSRFPSLGLSAPVKSLRYTEYLQLRQQSPEKMQSILTSKLYVELCTGSLTTCPFDSLIQYLQTLADCVVHYTALLKFDQSHSGVISESDFVAYVRDFSAKLSFVPPDHFDDYVLFVTERILVVVDPLRAKRISIRALMNETIMISWVTMRSASDVTRQPLGPEIFDMLRHAFEGLDSDKDGYVTAEDLTHMSDCRLLLVFCTRACEVIAGDTKLNFGQFLRFRFVWDSAGYAWANTILFDILDIDSNGLITIFEMHYFYKQMMAKFNERFPDDQRKPPLEAFMSEAFDICQSTDDGITKDNFVKSRGSESVLKHMLDLRSFVKSELNEDILG